VYGIIKSFITVLLLDDDAIQHLPPFIYIKIEKFPSQFCKFLPPNGTNPLAKGPTFSKDNIPTPSIYR
jgi:hypothetical protein